MLLTYYKEGVIEAGCDEAGRGCLAGPVYAAAVILPPDYHNDLLNDSKQLSEKRRNELRAVIEREAVAWAVGTVDNREIDRINILNASILAMHRALDGLGVRPQEIIVDGNRFKPYRDLHSGSQHPGQDTPRRVHGEASPGISTVSLGLQQGLPRPRTPPGHTPSRRHALPPSHLPAAPARTDDTGFR